MTNHGNGRRWIDEEGSHLFIGEIVGHRNQAAGRHDSVLGPVAAFLTIEHGHPLSTDKTLHMYLLSSSHFFQFRTALQTQLGAISSHLQESKGGDFISLSSHAGKPQTNG